MPETRITSIRRLRGRGKKLEITSIFPNRVFKADPGALETPHAFKIAAERTAGFTPQGRVWGNVEDGVLTLGKLKSLWTEMIERASSHARN